MEKKEKIKKYVGIVMAIELKICPLTENVGNKKVKEQYDRECSFA